MLKFKSYLPGNVVIPAPVDLIKIYECFRTVTSHTFNYRCSRNIRVGMSVHLKTEIRILCKRFGFNADTDLTDKLFKAFGTAKKLYYLFIFDISDKSCACLKSSVTFKDVLNAFSGGNIRAENIFVAHDKERTSLFNGILGCLGL